MTSQIERQSPKELFKTLVEEACDHQHLDASESSHVYLVHLLEAFVRPERLFSENGVEADQPLASLFFQAYSSDGPRRFALFKLTGDLSLFFSGFYADSLYSGPVGVDYYVRLGGSAYTGAAGSCGRASGGAVFNELSEKFARFVDVLGEVSEQCSLTDDSHLLRLYETWLATGSRRSAAILRRQGVVLDRNFGSPH